MNENITDWKLNIQELVQSGQTQSEQYTFENLKYYFRLHNENKKRLIFYFHYVISDERYNSYIIICIKNQDKKKNYTIEISFPIKSDGKSKIKLPINLDELIDPNNEWIHDNDSLIFSIKVKNEDLTNHLKQNFKMIDYNLDQYYIIDLFPIPNIRNSISQRISSSYQFGKGDEISFYLEGKSNPEQKIQLDLVFSDLKQSLVFSVYILFQNRSANNSKYIYENISFSPENDRHSFIFDVAESDFNEFNGWVFRNLAQVQFKIANFEFSEFPERTSFVFPNSDCQSSEQAGHHNYFSSYANILALNNRYRNPLRLRSNGQAFDHFNHDYSDVLNSSHESNILQQHSIDYEDENGHTISDINQHFSANPESLFNENFLANGLHNLSHHLILNQHHNHDHYESLDTKPDKSDDDEKEVKKSPSKDELFESKKGSSENDIGLAGLQNQGATCYLNSAIQLLFHIPAFRKVVYQMKIDENSNSKSDRIALSLQKLFIEMQVNNHGVCSTSDLTKSFGYSQIDLVTMHDVQEFIRTLIDSLENAIKGTTIDGEIEKIFRGKSCTVLEAPQINYVTLKNEDFYDLPIDVRGSPNLEESFKNFLIPEQLDGNNLYVIDGYGPQKVEMHTEFIEYPDVLQIHLKRFDFDTRTQMESKINDRFEFPSSIDLTPYLSKRKSEQKKDEKNDHESEPKSEQESESKNDHESEPKSEQESKSKNDHENEPKNEQESKSKNDHESEPKSEQESDQNKSENIYDLYCILVHEGFAQIGHYYAFIRQILNSDNKGNFTFNSDLNDWFKFNDDTVTKSTYSDAVVNNYGGSYIASSGNNNTMYGDKVFSAYMVVYVRRDKVVDIMKPVTDDEIPPHLQDFIKELQQKEKERKEREEKEREEKQRSSYLSHIDNFYGFGRSRNYNPYEEEIIELTFMTEESFFSNFTKDIIGLDLKEKKVTTKLSAHSTVEEVYKAAYELLDVEEGTIRLWLTTGECKPYKPFFRNKFCSISENYFVQPKKKEESLKPIKPLTYTAFVIFFDIALDLPGQYIGSTQLKKNDPISVVFQFAREKLGLPEDADFLTYKEEGGPNPFTLVDPTTMLREKSSIVVLQLKNHSLLSNSNYIWKTRDDIINALLPDDSYKKYDNLPFFNLIEENRSKISDAASYFLAIRRFIYAIVYMMNKPDNPRIRIKYSTTFSITELSDFIATQLKLKYNKENDSVLLFNSCVNSWRFNNEYMTTFKDVSTRKEYKIYVQLIKGLNFEAIQKSKAIHILVSFDGFNVSFETKTYIEEDTQVFTIISYLIEENILTDSIIDGTDENEDKDNKVEEDNGDEDDDIYTIKAMELLDEDKIRIYQVNNHMISQVWGSEDIIPKNTNEIRIDVIPKNEYKLSSTQVLVKGCHKHSVSQTIYSCLDPFFFVIDLEERVRELKERLRNTIHMDDPWEDCSIYLGKMQLSASQDPVKIQYILDQSNPNIIIFHKIQKIR